MLLVFFTREVVSILEILHDKMEKGLAISTLNAQVAAFIGLFIYFF